MNSDRATGSAKQLKGAVKEIIGNALGDAKLQAEGKSDKAEGKVQNAVGGLKDKLEGSERRRQAALRGGVLCNANCRGSGPINRASYRSGTRTRAACGRGIALELSSSFWRIL